MTDWFRNASRQVAEQFGLAPAVITKRLLESATARLVGRQVTFRGTGGDVTLVLRLLRLVRPPVALMIGQVGDVEIDADDVQTPTMRIRRLHLDVRNLHLQPGPTSTTVVAAPIRARAVLDAAMVSTMVADRTTRAEIELRADGPARAYVTGRRAWGHVDLVPRLEGASLVLAPSDIVVRGSNRLSGIAGRLPPLRVALPEVAAGVHLAGVTVEDGQLVVEAVYEEFRREFAAEDFEQLRRRIERFEGGLLDITTG